MQKKICFVLTLTIIGFVDSSPVKIDTLKFDNLNTDLSKLGYEVEEEDLDDFSKLLDEADGTTKAVGENTSGFKKKTTENKGVQSKHDIGDIKKFFKAVGAHDQGSHDDADIYALAEGIVTATAGTNGKESRTYKKGTKTRGFHRVHHKDEYKKDQEFYEDDETTGTIKKVGAKALGVKLGAGVNLNKGYFDHDRQKGIYGKRGYLDKGYLDADINGYSDSQGFDRTFKKSI